MNEELGKDNQILIAVIEERLDNFKTANNIDHQLIIKKIDAINGIRSDIRWLTWAVRMLIASSMGFLIWLVKLSFELFMKK